MVGEIEILQPVARQNSVASRVPRCSRRSAHRRTVDGPGERDASAISGIDRSQLPSAWRSSSQPCCRQWKLYCPDGGDQSGSTVNVFWQRRHRPRRSRSAGVVAPRARRTIASAEMTASAVVSCNYFSRRNWAISRPSRDFRADQGARLAERLTIHKVRHGGAGGRSLPGRTSASLQVSADEFGLPLGRYSKAGQWRR